MPASLQHIIDLLRDNEPGTALEQCRALCEESPGEPEAWLLLGDLQMHNGDLSGAGHSYLAAQALNPDEPRVWYALGMLNSARGNTPNAVTAYRAAIERNPQFTAALNNLGMLYLAAGDHPEARRLLEQALLSQPDNAMLHTNLGLCLRNSGDLDGAAREFESAIACDDGHANAYYHLANMAQLKGDGQRAIALYRRAVDLQPGNLPARIALAQTSAAAGNMEEAFAEMEQALSLAPDHPDVISVLAGLHEKQGEFDEALALLGPSLAAASVPPSVALVYGLLCRRLQRPQDAIPVLSRALQRTDTPAPLRQELLFRLGDVLIDTGRDAQGFEQYVAANAMFNNTFDRNLEARRFSTLTSVFSRTLLDRPRHAARDGANMIFIVGMPRSGTSLAEQILAAHPLCHGGGELPFLAGIAGSFPAYFGAGAGYPGFMSVIDDQGLDRLATQYLDRVAALAPEALRVTDKTPHNFLHLGLIQQLFPAARVIHCSRDPRDTCLSIYTHNFNANHPYASGLDTLGWYYNRYQELMKHWRGVLRIPVFELRYEELVTDTEAVARRLVDFCGLSWDERCLKFHESARIVNTPSYDQVRQPVYTSSIGRWKRFESQLRPLIEALEHPGGCNDGR